MPSRPRPHPGLPGFRAVVLALACVALLRPAPCGAAHPEVPPEPNGTIASDTCLGCHDGVLARNVHTRDVRVFPSLPQLPSAVERERVFGHPVGSDYARALTDRRLRLRSPFQVSERLENGRLGCVSCHDLRAQNRARLALGSRGNVCLSCHEL